MHLSFCPLTTRGPNNLNSLFDPFSDTFTTIPRRYGYERELMRKLQDLVRDMNRKIEKNKVYLPPLKHDNENFTLNQIPRTTF